MCGICGKLNFDRHEPVDARLVVRMMDSIRHRGPDGTGRYVQGPVGLGHRRLSIIDLQTGTQPMSNEDGSVWVVYNGEIYNFEKLRAELESRGHIFKSKSDTEVIVHAYEEWEEEALGRFRGMFAFALWDARKEMLLLARDRVGIKPLYYVNTGRSILFASELKCFLVDSTVSRRVNQGALDRFLMFHYLPGTETLMEGVEKLAPGHFVIVRNGRLVTRQYWDLNFETAPVWTDFGDAVEELQDLLGRTVEDHMISDVPVGVLLSGGVDSSGVLGYAAEQADRPLRTFTVGFADANVADERPYARMAAERYGTEHSELTLSPAQFRDFLPNYVWHMEEPICEPPAVALYYVARLASRSDVKVLLSGEGGDEAFGGYTTYRNLLFLERLKSGFGAAKGLLRFGLHVMGKMGVQGAIGYAGLVDRSLPDYYLSRTATPHTMFHLSRMRLRASKLQVGVFHLGDEATRQLFHRVEGRSVLNHMLYVDTKSWLPDDLLVKADKMTMAASTELRVPLLDFRILEFAAALPAHFKVRNASTKRVLKAALEGLVPQQIVKRKKAGFPVPYEGWLKGPLRDFVSDTLLASNSGVHEYFESSELRRFVEQSQQRGDCSKEIFSLLVLEFWHRQFLVQPPAREPSERLQPICVSRG